MQDFKCDVIIENFKKDLSRKRKWQLSSWGSQNFVFVDERGCLINKSITFQVVVRKQKQNTQREKQENDLCVEANTKWRNNMP